jgi:hypothetical protein
LRKKGASFVMIALADACRLAVLGLAVASAAVSATADEPPPPADPLVQTAAPAPPDSHAAKPTCLNAADTRETVRGRHFLEPYAALKSAAAQRKAEALSAKLCHTGDEFFYEITLLHHDGRLVRVRVDAATGKTASHGLRDSKEPAPKN